MEGFNVIIETDRLFLREFVDQDAENFEKINSDPNVIKYTSDHDSSPKEAIKRFINTSNEYKKYGMGRWAVVRKNDGKFLGWCGLKYHEDDKIVDVGYRFYKEFWGNGYATEAAKASLEYGFNTLKLKEIYAHAHPDNSSSENVLIKCGLSFKREVIYKNIKVKLFKISKSVENE
ncbi:GNAT family N-acetyltransferase [Flavobacteriaceae bacterium R38]|nr:GNAT family N-acetyltransferase [Flavobacteriaceae bacterium R38]